MTEEPAPRKRMDRKTALVVAAVVGVGVLVAAFGLLLPLKLL